MSEGVKYPGDDIKIIKGWESVLARPGMYIGKKSMYGLHCLLTGIQLANGVFCGGPSQDRLFEMSGDDWFEFEKWVSKKSNMKGVYVKSQDKALFASDNDDEKAFDLWASWFKEFKNEQAQSA